MKLRRATFEDCCILFEWRNDPMTRQMSINQDRIPIKTHIAWLESTLLDFNKELFIYEFSTENPVGTIRRDHREDGAWQLNYTIKPTMRCRGYGTRMVRSLLNLYPAKYIAEIKTSNTVSIVVVEKLGFKCVGVENNRGIFVNDLSSVSMV